MRGEAGRNNLEFKFVDASGDNVWWFRRARPTFSGDWQPLRIKRRQIDFAWGPTADARSASSQSIEFALSAGDEGGSGTLWFDRLPLEAAAGAARDDRTTDGARVVPMPRQCCRRWPSTARPDDAAGAAADADAQSLERRSDGRRDFGGLHIDWARDLRTALLASRLSDDGRQWPTVRASTPATAARLDLMPNPESRYVRLARRTEPGREYGINELDIQRSRVRRTPNRSSRRSRKDAPRGSYPRYFYEEQTYWTVVGVDGDAEAGAAQRGRRARGRARAAFRSSRSSSRRPADRLGRCARSQSLARRLPADSVVAVEASAFALRSPRSRRASRPRVLHAIYRLRQRAQRAAPSHAGARDPAFPGQPAVAVAQHGRRRGADPRSAVRRRRASG